MRIGLVRHFEVIHSSQKVVTSGEFKEWVRQYDIADVRQIPVDLCYNNWDLCFSSDLQRALQTAQNISKCKIVTTDLLREVPISPILDTNLRLPVPLWLSLGRMAWLFSHHSQPEKRIQTGKRINDFLTQIMSLRESNILLVTHGFLMFIITGFFSIILAEVFRQAVIVKEENDLTI
ncbi:histidine phosphatase family protein [Desulfosporosinus sp. BICA1-9]|uniref:histidine phosphatase family protein n=1 Tax=Desulfosporosinus sp. BICA1-9 TaxID=1531958 RepID=UPI000A8F08B0|nr:histidine phosphatase family protein [Desulfosporosinus sp. BICA1-9]HBW35438.1 phosphoglycerate mutase [Desulfosporosinus sp.]